MPTRPNSLELLTPRDIPKRKTGSASGHNALLHPMAYIELNTMFRHWHPVVWFYNTSMQMGFYIGFHKALDEESKHFILICDCFEGHESFYGVM